MRIPVKFELWDYPNQYHDTEYLCSEEEINGKFIAIRFNQKVYSQANKSSAESKARTHESLKEAVDKAVKDKHYGGTFFVYLDKGSAFDLED